MNENKVKKDKRKKWTSLGILGLSLFVAVYVHWLFFPLGLLLVIGYNVYEENEEVRKWFN